MMRLFQSILLVAALVFGPERALGSHPEAVIGSAGGAAGEAEERVEPGEPVSDGRWCGVPTAVADATAVTAAGFAAGCPTAGFSGTLAVHALPAYFLGGALVHWTGGDGTVALRSFALRAGGFGLVGLSSLSCHREDWLHQVPSCGFARAAGLAALPAALVVDAAMDYSGASAGDGEAGPRLAFVSPWIDQQQKVAGFTVNGTL